MTFKIILSFGVALLTMAASAGVTYESETSLQGVHRNFPNGASSITNINEGFLESRTGFRYSTDNFQMEAKALLRSIQSPANQDSKDFAFTSLEPPRRLFKLYTKIGPDDSANQTYLDTGSLWGSYNKENWTFSAGRRAIGIGVLKVFPVWNRLYPVVPTLSGYMLVNNPDVVDVRWSKSQWTVAMYSIFSQYYDDAITAMEFIHYGEKLESHFIVSDWWQQATAGYSGVVDSDMGIFRLETLGIAQGSSNTSKGFQVGLGWERAFTAKLSFLAEYYHSSFGTRKTSDYLLQDPTAFRTLLATDYIYPKLSYKITDFLSNDLGALCNLIDGSFMIINETNYSLSDTMDLFALIKKPTGTSGKEFGHLTVPVTNQTLEYVEWFSIGLKMTI
jgi:hypothetical protein